MPPKAVSSSAVADVDKSDIAISHGDVQMMGAGAFASDGLVGL